MIDFTIKVADNIINVSALHRSTCERCADYLWEGAADFSVVITHEDIAYESKKADRERALEGLPPHSFSDGYLELTAVQRKIAEELFCHDTLIFPGSVVAVDGNAYLFTAKSGTGKSTHTRLWRELFGDRAVMVNDDKPFLKITEKGVIAYGSPWNGKHHLGSNVAVPLKAICVLERSEHNQIQRIAPQYALPMLIQQSNRPVNGGLMGKYMDLIDGLSHNVEFYRMGCNMDPEAARVAYEGMNKV